MASSSRPSGPRTKTARPRVKDTARRALVFFTVAIAVLLGTLTYGVTRSNAEWTPRLGLDLAGGTQIILEPRVGEGQSVGREQLEQARDIITQRVDAQGTTGAEVTTQGDTNVVVSMPGTPTAAQEEAISASSQMQFRPVLASDLGSPQAAEPDPAATGGSGPTSPAPSSAPSGSSSGPASPSTSPSPQVEEADPSRSSTPASRDRARSALPAETSAEPSSSSTAKPSSSSSAKPSSSSSAKSSSSSAKPSGADPSAVDPSELPVVPGAGQLPDWTPTAKPTGPLDPNNIDAKLWDRFRDLDCSVEQEKPVESDGSIVACSADGSLKYVLGPVVVRGDQIDSAEAGYKVSPQGQQTNQPEIALSFKSSARKTYGDISSQMVALPPLNPGVNAPGSYNALATVLDSQVLLAPSFREAIPTGNASIDIQSIDEARSLAQSLKFGALPISFDLQTRQEISPTLGSEQLRYGIIAGLIGLGLVILYSIAQYRALALVTIGSMIAAFGVTYLVISLLAWGYNYRLDMAGVTGLIIAIGVTADSFIVYFERVRDELREGRNLRAAVEAGWQRAKRTILVADGVNFLAAIILYVLASSGVRGFAFTLGLTTLIDLLIFWVFTHPLLTLLARSRFFASGHPWSGFDVGSLRKPSVRYSGRGRVAVQPGSTTTEGSAS